MPRRLVLLAIVAVSGVLAGCSDAGTIDAEVVVSGAGSTGSEARISGELVITPEGCLGVDVGGRSFVVVWPRGSSATPDGVEVDGRRLAIGSSFSGAGGFSDADELPPSAYYPASCGDGEVAILDSLSD